MAEWRTRVGIVLCELILINIKLLLPVPTAGGKTGDYLVVHLIKGEKHAPRFRLESNITPLEGRKQ